MFNDIEYFKTEKKGELYELTEELRGDKKERKKEALKRIINYMTVGKDMSSIFTDVVNLIQTENTEQKKLVYLYLINYAHAHPDKALLAVNTFVRDCEDPNPLVRAIAVRTMGCIRVDQILEYLCEPLRRCLRDEDPYVRKTAAICVLKIFNFNREVVFDRGFIDDLNHLLGDANAMVLSNAVAALNEISQKCQPKRLVFKLTINMVNKLLTAMNECTEWGQISILECLSRYDCESENEAQSICERVTSRLSHSNSALVLSAIKVLLKAILLLGSENPLTSQILKKISPPLITMLSLEFEIQYVALRNINLIVQKYPTILKHDTKSFFVKYNDPIYIKLEKLAIIIKLVNEENVNQILSELKEYASEVDVDFVRRSVRAIGTCALMVETAANKCVNALVELIQTKITYVVQEAVIVTRDIMRRFPKTYDGLIEKFSGNWWTIDEPDSRAAFIWIVGELSDHLENSQDILKSYVSSFFDENSEVQLQVLTAVVKLFLKKPAETQDLVQELLTLVTQKIENPDIRDRGFIYWRLLSTDPAAAKEIVLAPKPVISSESDNLNTNLLDELLLNLSSLSSVYHKLPHTLVDGRVHLHDELQKRGSSLQMDLERTCKRVDQKVPTIFDSVSRHDSSIFNKYQDDLLDLDFSTPPSTINLPQSTQPTDDIDMLSDIFYTASVTPSASTSMAPHDFRHVDLFSVVERKFYQDLYTPPPSAWLTFFTGKGLEVIGHFNLSPSLSISMTLSNQALAPFSNFTIQLNKNYFGLVIKGPVVFPNSLLPKQSTNVIVSLEYSGSPTTTNAAIDVLQVAIKNNVEVLYFTVIFPLHFYFKSPEECSINEKMFSHHWSSISPDCQQERMITALPITQSEAQAKFSSLRIFSLNLSSTPACIGHCVLMNNVSCFIKIFTGPSVSAQKIVVACTEKAVIDPLIDLIGHAFL